MTSSTTRPDQDKLKLPASSWWIPSLTALAAVLAVLVAFA
jgi:hypothetical protein